MRKIVSDSGTLGQRILRQIVSGEVQDASATVAPEFDVEQDLENPDYDPPHGFFRDRFEEAELYHDAQSVVDEVTLGPSTPQAAKADTSPTEALSAKPTEVDSAGSD